MRPSRLRPAAASTRAEQSPASSLRSRVSTLPRIGRNADVGNATRSAAIRRTLLVPIVAPRPSSAVTASHPLAALDAASTMASRGSSRGSVAASRSPSGSIAGRSLLLCTARSMRLSRSASSISFTNRRLTATPSGAGASGGAADDSGLPSSPDVRITTSSVGGPPASAMSRATVSACQRASALPRVPIFMTRSHRWHPTCIPVSSW